MFSNFNLTILNLMIGMCKGVRGLPDCFRIEEYVEKAIERPFRNADHDVIQPEIVLASRSAGNAIMVESKSGQNTSEAQLRRYANTTPDNLRDQVPLDPESCRSLETVLIGLEEHEERLSKGLVDGGFPFPLVLANREGLKLVLNRFGSSALTDAFTPCLAVDWDRVPRSFVGINKESSLHEAALVILPYMLQSFVKREDRIPTAKVTSELLQVGAAVGKPLHSEIENKVRDVLREAAQHEFKVYLKWHAASGGHAEIVYNPVEYGSSKRTAAYRRLNSIGRDFVERLRLGRQMDLFG